MPVVAVVAHARKNLGGGLPELRHVLAESGCADPIWHEVTKSRKAPKRARRALADGAELIFVWGGDGTVQRCVDALAGTPATLAIIPAGTANLLATNLGVPTDISSAVEIGMHGRRHQIDTGTVNGEHFAVMAGAGFDARMIKEADRKLKGRLGRAAYIYAGLRNLTSRRVRTNISVDGKHFFKGRVSCVLTGNVGTILGGIEAFPAARADDGLLDLGVVTAGSPAQWARVLARLVVGKVAMSPFARITRGRKFVIRFDEPVPYELDGGSRKDITTLRIDVRPSSVSVCVPADPHSNS